MAIFSKFFGRTVSEAAGVAAGLAVAAPLRPVVQLVENETWALHPDRPVSVGQAAAIVAEDVELDAWGVQQASWTGFNEPTFRAVLGETLNAPDLGTLYTAWRRSDIGDADFTHGLRKAKLETRWDAALQALKTERLDPAVIANAIVRGIMTNPGILPVGPPTEAGTVPAFPVSPLDPVTEAAASGIDLERLFVETAIVGRPMSLHEAASAYFRSIIELTDYHRAVAEGDTRNEWADAILEQARQILTAHDYIELRLRGWIDDAAMYAGTAKHGMSQADTDQLLEVSGRPLSWHQVFIGLRRGGVYNGPTADIAPAFLKALQESNIRPEWYDLAWSQRYAYPTAFVLRTLTTDGDLTAAETEQILLFEGWEPSLAAKVATKWAAGTAGGLTPAVKSAQTKFLTAIHKAFVKGGITDAQMVQQLALSELDAADQTGVADFYRKERALEQIPPPVAA